MSVSLIERAVLRNENVNFQDLLIKSGSTWFFVFGTKMVKNVKNHY